MKPKKLFPARQQVLATPWKNLTQYIYDRNGILITLSGFTEELTYLDPSYGNPAEIFQPILDVAEHLRTSEVRTIFESTTVELLCYVDQKTEHINAIHWWKARRFIQSAAIEAVRNNLFENELWLVENDYSG